MTSKSAKQKSPANVIGTGVKFINYPLSLEQKNELKALEYGADSFVSDLDKLCDSSYKASFSYDDYNNCYAAFLTPRDEKSVNRGLILTARGSTVLKAMKQLLYLHYTLFDESWADFYQGSGAEPLDD
jgi:hypothetical protein